MKLKYKKIILLTTMSTMGIGLLTLSLKNPNPSAEELVNEKNTAQAVMSVETAVESETETNGEDALTAAMAAEPTSEVSPTPTTAATPTPLPVYEIETEGYPKINKLIEDYYTAKNNRDVDALKSLLSDPAEADTQEELQQKTEYIDEYLNIKVYVKKGYLPDTYIVYAYHEIKFTGINTPAPGLAKFYIITDESGNVKIFSGTLDAEVQVYYDERNSDEDVIALIEMTDKKSDEAIESDEDLLNFWKNIDEMANETAGATETEAAADNTAEGDTN